MYLGGSKEGKKWMEALFLWPDENMFQQVVLLDWKMYTGLSVGTQLNE